MGDALQWTAAGTAVLRQRFRNIRFSVGRSSKAEVEGGEAIMSCPRGVSHTLMCDSTKHLMVEGQVMSECSICKLSAEQ